MDTNEIINILKKEFTTKTEEYTTDRNETYKVYDFSDKYNNKIFSIWISHKNSTMSDTLFYYLTDNNNNSILEGHIKLRNIICVSCDNHFIHISFEGGCMFYNILKVSRPKKATNIEG